jgi:hypothetical protein
MSDTSDTAVEEGNGDRIVLSSGEEVEAFAAANANSATEVVVGANGTVYAAPVGTTPPSDSGTAPAAAFQNLGFMTEDGLSPTWGKTTTDLRAWQSFYPLRQLITERALRVAFVMRQWSKTTVQLALEGVVTGTAPNFTFTPGAPEVVNKNSFIFDWLDGTKKYRLYLPVAMSVEDVESNIVRSDGANLPLTVAVQDPGAGNSPWLLFTNDTSFA